MRSIRKFGRDTTVFLAHDAAGNICSGTSTSGWGWKYPGRLGDSPIVGAGSYADTRYGAAACTGAGEMTIRCCTARSIVLYMKQGASVADAVSEAVEDMRALKGGLISRVTIHAIDTKGNHKVVAVNGAGDNKYWLWEGQGEPRLLPAEPMVITTGRHAADLDVTLHEPAAVNSRCSRKPVLDSTRLTNLADGIFAVAMTFLAFTIQLPAAGEGTRWRACRQAVRTPPAASFVGDQLLHFRAMLGAALSDAQRYRPR